MGRKAIATFVFFLLLASTVSAASFNFGITPPEIDAGDRQPGSTFFGSFYAVSSSDQQISFDIEISSGDIRRFEGIEPDKVDQFSAQSCVSCVEFLRGGGELEDAPAQQGDIKKWKVVEFLVSVPDDIEPGYHLLEMAPEPDTPAGGGGGVSVSSATNLPVVFHVPGEVNREGKILGLRAGENVNGRQEIEATYYNSGTVTTYVDPVFHVETRDGSEERLQADGDTVAPGETASFTYYVQSETINDTFTTTFVGDYHTGQVAKEAELEKNERTVTATGSVTEDPGETSLLRYLLAAAFLAVTAVFTWMVVRHLQH